MISKWTGELLISQSIYDLYIEFNQYPYLETKNHLKEQIQLDDFIVKELPVININQLNTINSLQTKLNIMSKTILLRFDHLII